MAMKVDNASSVESRPSQITVNSPSAALTGTSKMSKFGMKSGFVIPKNKLSGSLVPVFRGAAKVENETIKEENNKQIQRKTKWGTDLTQDATVRRGRALAYQTRVEQITKQLKSGAPEKGDEDHTTKPPNEIPNDESSRNQVDDQARKLEMLELEKREAIGEILKLNPSYKAPPDYKPLMKEASIPVPDKLYPGLNIVSLILGPGNNTQKRLEEETGARIQIKGTKAGSADEVEITLSDKTDAQSAYEKLFVHVSADTFEKVDAAVGLIELLVTPVSGMVPTAPSSVSGDGANVLQQNQDTTSSQVISGPVVNPGMMQSMAGSMQPGFPPQVQFHPYPAPWFPTDHMRPLNNFAPMSNSSAPMPNNAIQFPSPQNTSNMPQFFGGYPPGVGSSLAPRNPAFASHAQQQPPHGFQRPYFRDAPPNSQGPSLRMHPGSGSQPHVGYPSFPAQPNHPVLHQNTSNQPRTAGPGPGPGQVILSQPQPFSSAPSGQPPNMQSTSSGWPASTIATPSQPAPFQRPPVVSQPLMTSGTGSSNVPAVVMSRPSGNMGSPASFPPRPSAQLPNTTGNHPVAGANFSFVVHQRSPLAQNPVMAGPLQAASSMPRSPSALSPYPRVSAPTLAQATVPALPPSNQSSPMAHMQPVGLQGPAPNQPMVGVPPVPPPLPSTSRQLSINTNSASGSLPSFASPKPPTSNPQTIPATTPKPHRPSSGDFTFQPPRSPLPVSQTVPRPNDQSTPSPSVPPNAQVQPPPAPQTPSYRPAVQSAGPQNLMQSFPNTPPNNQMIHPQTQLRPPSQAAPSSFPGNPSSIRPSPRFSEFSNPNPPGPPHMGPRSFTQAPQMSNFPGRFPPQMMNPPQMQHNQPNLSIRPGSFMAPHQNQQYGNNPGFPSGRPASSSSGNQVYDPFSPTSVSSAPQHPENPAKIGKPEEDPEYDDLMASVGVR